MYERFNWGLWRKLGGHAGDEPYCDHITGMNGREMFRAYVDADIFHQWKDFEKQSMLAIKTHLLMLDPRHEGQYIRRPYAEEISDKPSYLIEVCDGFTILWMSFAKRLFKDAIDRGIRENANPCNTVDTLERIEATPQETCHRALSVEESERFFESAEDSHYRELFIVMSETGMRLGEASSLTLDDLDFKNKEIYITKTVTRDKDCKTEIGDTPKTKAGNRMIPMTKRCEAALMERIRKNEIFYSDDSDLVFRSARGRIIQSCNVRYEMTLICKKANIKTISGHALRALFATRFREQFPENPFVLKAILGHSESDVTALYAVVTKSTLHLYMKRFNLFYNPCKAKCKAKLRKVV